MTPRRTALDASSPNIWGLLAALGWVVGGWVVWDWRHGDWE